MKTTKAKLGAAAAVSWATLTLLAAAALYEDRQEFFLRAAAEGHAVVTVLEAHTGRTFDAVGITLDGLASAWLERSTRHGEVPAEDARFEQRLADRLERLKPYAHALAAIDTNGEILLHVEAAESSAALAGLSTILGAAARTGRLERDITPPFRTPDGRLAMAVTRRVDDEVILAAAIEPGYFESVYRTLRGEAVDTVMLFHDDGTLLARFPAEEGEIGQSFRNSSLFERLAGAQSGWYFTALNGTQQPRLVTYRKLEGLPLVVALGRDTRGILAPWHSDIVRALLALTLLGVLLAALVAMFLRQQRIDNLRRERSLQAEKLEALGHLTAGVTHDFANLLSVLSSSSRVISLHADGNERVQAAAAISERALERGSRLVEQLRTFARRRPLDVQPADLNALVTSSSNLLRQASGSSTQLQMQLAPRLAPVLADQSELEVTLLNLIVNAKDSGARNVVLRTYDGAQNAQPAAPETGSAANYVGLAIIDDGSGMSSDVRRRAFDPYFSTKGEEGTGLGLAQVHGFLRQIGGDVIIEPASGRGTTVHLMFPKATMEHDTTGSHGEARKIAGELGPQ